MFCFATGSLALSSDMRQRQVHVFDVVEYLTYNLAQERVSIVADFLAVNLDTTEQRFRFLHRGNVDFFDITDGWQEDPRTPLLWEGSQHYQDPLEAVTCPKGLARIDLEHASVTPPVSIPRFNAPPEYSPLESDGDLVRPFVPFSLYETAPLPPGKPTLLRVRGVLSGPSYRTLVYRDHGDARPADIASLHLPIYGGDILLNLIRREDLGDSPTCEPCQPSFDPELYRTLLAEFMKEYFSFDNKASYPNKYHLRINTRTEGDPPYRLRVSLYSPDLRPVFSDMHIGHHLITYCWSDRRVFQCGSRINGLEASIRPTAAVARSEPLLSTARAYSSVTTGVT